MKNLTSSDGKNEDRPCVLVEGPCWGDAEFYGQWLLAAAKAKELLQTTKKRDAEFYAAIATLEMMQDLDFGIMATVFVSRLAVEFDTFIIDAASSDLLDFVLMAEMGFFTRTGDRYQMTLPTSLEMGQIKRAHLKLARTEDDNWIHPEQLLPVSYRDFHATVPRTARPSANRPSP
jgi:hypothetical protein